MCPLLHAPFDAFVLDEQDPRARAKVRGYARRFSVSMDANMDPPPFPPCSGSRDNDRVGRRTVIEVAVSQRPASTTPCKSPIRIDSTLTESFPLNGARLPKIQLSSRVHRYFIEFLPNISSTFVPSSSTAFDHRGDRVID